MELDKSIVDGVNKANKKLGSVLYVLANEPSVGLYHVQEHIRKTLPKNVEVKREIRKKYQAIEAMTYDINFSIQTVKSLHDLDTFQGIKKTMEECMNKINSMNRGSLSGSGRRSAPSTPSRVGPIFAPPTPTLDSTPTSTLSSIAKPDSPRPLNSDKSADTSAESSTSSISSITPADNIDASSNTANTDATYNYINTTTSSSNNTNNTLTNNDDTTTNDEPDDPDNPPAASEVDEVGVTPRKVKKPKKPKAAKNLSRNFDLTPKHF